MTGAGADRVGPVVVHSLADALAAARSAAASNKPLHLVSAVDCGAAAGTGWFAALGDLVAERFPALDLTLTLDSGDQAGIALGALRHGLKSVVFTGDPVTASRLMEVAGQTGATILRERPDALDLLDTPNPEAICARWFGMESAGALG